MSQLRLSHVELAELETEYGDAETGDRRVLLLIAEVRERRAIDRDLVNAEQGRPRWRGQGRRRK